ncbi:uncharacterized protein AAES06_014541 isoform 2-T7 [Glossophaga mutica]
MASTGRNRFEKLSRMTIYAVTMDFFIDILSDLVSRIFVFQAPMESPFREQQPGCQSSEHQLWSQEDLGSNPSSPSSLLCELDKFIQLSEPQFPHNNLSKLLRGLDEKSYENGILPSHKKKGNTAICDNMEGS